MSIQTIERLASPAESLRRGSTRIKSALSERALKRKLILHSQQLEEFHQIPGSIDVTDGRQLTQALTAVREIAELTLIEEQAVAHSAKAALDDSAEHLFGDLKEATEINTGRGKVSIGITAVHDALRAWDLVRTDATYDLAEVALDNFHGLGKDNLLQAFNAAKKSGSPFSDELDNIND